LVRVATGILFVFSGYVKLVDPIGSKIKFGEYFEAFEQHVLVPFSQASRLGEYFESFWTHVVVPGSLTFGVLLAVVELVTGLCLLFGLRMKLASLTSVAFMVFFTALTFVLAVTDAVKDCGCFGDAVKLTNWQTFYKNLIILPFTVYMFVERRKYKTLMPGYAELSAVGLLILASVGISTYCYRHLPLIDFIAYKVGTDIPKEMSIPEGAPEDVYAEGTYIYEKNGEKQTFTLDNLPDSTWVFVDAPAPKLLKKGYVPKIQDFSISSSEGLIHDKIFGRGGYMIFLTSENIAGMKTDKSALLNELYGFSAEHGVNFMMLTASQDDVADYAAKTNAAYPIFFTDATALKSMVRSNPGMMLLKDNVILDKWHYSDFPSVEELKELIAEDPAKVIADHYASLRMINLLLAGFAIAILIGAVIKLL
jgi:uncharacterized membrane protein YphA (DoxX/SURF4 family)